MSVNNTLVIKTVGRLELQETTIIRASRQLDNGEIVRLQEQKSLYGTPYGLAEVLKSQTNNRSEVRRVA